MTRRGGVSPSQKSVKLGDPYGDLPTPTRMGYTFKGWHSKNIINICTRRQGASIEAIYDEDANEITFNNASSVSGNGYTGVEIQLYSNSSFNSCLSSVSSGIGSGTFTKSGATHNAVRLKANGNNADCAFFFDLSDFPDGEFTVYFNVKSKTVSTTYEGRFEKFVIENVQIERSSSFTGYEKPMLITNSTQNTTIGDHTLIAQWTPNNYQIIYYENKNILDGGAMLSSKTISHDGWEEYTSGATAFTTQDGYACAKISGAMSTTKYLCQNILDKIKFNTNYIVSINAKVVNYSAGTTNPFLALYFDGNYNNNGTGTWYGLMGNKGLGEYSSQGWKDVYYHTTSNSTVTSSTANTAFAFLYARDFTGDIYFRNYSVAEATNTSRTVTFDKSPGTASVLSHNGYDFQGYYTQPVGGIKIYNADGSVVNGVAGYTDSNGNWTRAEATNVYGQWKQWEYLPDSAGATFVNTQALQNSNGGRGKRVVQINTTKNASGTARTYKYSWDGSNWSDGASLVTKTSQGDQTLYVRVYPTGGEHYRGYVQTSITVHLNKLAKPQLHGYKNPAVFGGDGWYVEARRRVQGATLVCWSNYSDRQIYGPNNKGVFNDDNWHWTAGWSGYLIAFATTQDITAYHYMNGFIDSGQSYNKMSANSYYNGNDGGNNTWYNITDDGQLVAG